VLTVRAGAMRGILVGVCVGVVGAVLVLIGAPSAHAVATCNFDALSGNLTVAMSSSGDVARLDVVGSQIQLTGSGGNPCPASATLADTDAINVADNSSGGFTQFLVGQPADFGSEDFTIGLGDGGDVVSLIGGAGADNWRIGSSGSAPELDFDADGTSELFLVAGVDTWNLVGEAGNDTISAQGFGAVGPFTQDSVQIQGREDNDVLEGGDHPDGDELRGEAGDDTLRGFGGNDTLDPGAGDHTLNGGAGTQDLAAYSGSGPVTVDLATTQPQATGQGTDTLVDVEDVAGSQSNDTLLGSAGTNRLFGGGGDDLLDGRAGADVLDGGSEFPIGGPGSDTATYAASPSAVTVDLTTGQASGGLGGDTLIATENVIGSRFADTLVGDAGPNSLTGLAGADTISALAGADSVEVRDGAPDKADCGPDADTATADSPGIDALTACETVDFLPEGGGGGQPPNDFTFGKVKKNKRKGTAKLTVIVPGPGGLELAGKSLKATSKAAAAAGEVKLKVKAKGNKKRKLNQTGKTKVRPAVTYTPSGGTSATQDKKVRLVKR
jgi:Ca2+-binding RTX toxin-like protein